MTEAAAGWLDPASSAALGLGDVLCTLASLASSDLGRTSILDLAGSGGGTSSRAARRELFALLWKPFDDTEPVRRLEAEPLELAPLLHHLEDPRPQLRGRALVRLVDVLEQALRADRALGRLESDLLGLLGAATGNRDPSSGPSCDQSCDRPTSDPEVSPPDRQAHLVPDARIDSEGLSALARLVRDRLDEQGEVRPDATPALRAASQRVARRRRSLYDQFEGFLRQHDAVFEESTLSMRDGRLTALLPSGSKGQIGGLHHGRSATGRSFYFEPLELVDGNNALQDARGEEAAERARVLEELQHALQDHRQAAARAVRYLAALDVQQAIRRWAVRARAVLVESSPADGGLQLVGARHPLLDPALHAIRLDALGDGGHRGEVVPLDLVLQEERVLVITGPNAGGKTVALKTVGLFCALHRLGLPVPCDPSSRLPVAECIVAVVGDDQDLLQEQSTFSARLTRLRHAWSVAGPGALILLDEVGSGTSPQEGWALSQPLLERLVDRGATALMTTHLVELAAHALDRSGALCAGMEFDPELDAPRFKIRVGPPVASQALSLGRRLGLPAEWLSAAEGLLGVDYGGLVAALEQAESERDRLRDESDRLETLRRDQETLQRRLGEREAELIGEKKALRRRLEEELRKLRAEVREQVENEVRKLREAARRSKPAASGAPAVPGRSATESVIARAVGGGANQVAKELGLDEAVDPTPADRPPTQGDFVRHRALGWQGRLEELSGQRAVVAVPGGKRLRCSLGELLLAQEPGAGSKKGHLPRGAQPIAKRRRTAGRPDAESSSDDTQLLELHLIGQRVHEALEHLDHHLDHATLASLQSFRVVHGHGSGRLRSAVREHLRGHPQVQSYRPGQPREGGNGATVVLMRGAREEAPVMSTGDSE